MSASPDLAARSTAASGRFAGLSTDRRWALACAAAETVGMAAAAGAAKVSQGWVGEPDASREVAVALGLAVAGGLVEGVCLGLAQSWALTSTHPTHPHRLYVGITVAVAGIGWAGASLPGTLAGAGDGMEPPAALVALGGAGLGLAMGCLLGAVQALALRGVAARPWRWIGANAVAWVPAMAIIFLGATAPDASWAWWQVVGLGCVTGAAAGASLGAVLGRFAERLGSRAA